MTASASIPLRNAARQLLRLIGVAAALLGLGLAGCTRSIDRDTFVHSPTPLVTATEYKLSPPDVITIVSQRVREINGHTEQIRPDGRITLPLLGSVFVAGQTCEQVSAELQRRSREYYEDADVSLRVVGFNSKKIYVWGEVSAPGAYPYDGTNTVMGTLARAQPTRLANNGWIEVLRPNREGQLIRRLTIDLDDMVKNGDIALNGLLEEGDVIYVPPTPLASMGLMLQQLLLPIQPAVQVVQGPADIGLQSVGKRPYGSNP